MWWLHLSFLFSQFALASPKFQIGLETGAFWQIRNDLQRPQNTSNSLIKLDEIDSEPELFYRLESYFYATEKHAFRFLYAPLSIELKNRPTEVLVLNDQTFASGEEISFLYRFNSYRLTYFYSIYRTQEKQLNIGFTAKIRDAKTELRQGNRSTSFDNLGFVPLLYFEYLEPIFSNWFFHFNFDGLAGGPGRAFDFSFKLRRKWQDLGF